MHLPNVLPVRNCELLMKTRIRKAVPTDLDALSDIARRTIAASYRPFLGRDVVAGFIESGACDHYLRDNLEQCSVITIGGEAAGFCVCKEDLIDLMMIDHPHHRKGLGTRLLKHCDRALFETCATLRLESFAGNDRANDFYQKHGWSVAGSIVDEGTGSRKIVFEKQRPHL